MVHAPGALFCVLHVPQETDSLWHGRRLPMPGCQRIGESRQQYPLMLWGAWESPSGNVPPPPRCLSLSPRPELPPASARSGMIGRSWTRDAAGPCRLPCATAADITLSHTHSVPPSGHQWRVCTRAIACVHGLTLFKLPLAFLGFLSSCLLSVLEMFLRWGAMKAFLPCEGLFDMSGHSPNAHPCPK